MPAEGFAVSVGQFQQAFRRRSAQALHADPAGALQGEGALDCRSAGRAESELQVFTVTVKVAQFQAVTADILYGRVSYWYGSARGNGRLVLRRRGSSY